jgi:hypothetical protein
MKRKNPDTTTLLLLAGGAAAAYYFLVHKKKEDEKKAVVQAVVAATTPTKKFGVTGKQTGYTLPPLMTGGRLSVPAQGSLSFPPLTLAGGSLGSGGAGSLG